MTTPDNMQISSTWNSDDTLANYGNWSYTYDADKRITSQVYSGGGAYTGVGGTGSAPADTSTFHYTYTAGGKLSSFAVDSNPATAVTWDHDGNRLGYGSVTMKYNADDSAQQ